MNGSLNLHPKVAGGGLTGALALIILWAVSTYAFAVPVEVGAAFTVVLGFLGAYLAPIIAKEQPGVSKVQSYSQQTPLAPPPPPPAA